MLCSPFLLPRISSFASSEEYEELVFVLHQSTPHALMEQNLVRSYFVQLRVLGSRNNVIVNVAGKDHV